MCVCVCIRILFPNITVIKFLSKDTNPIESSLRVISPISSSSFQSPNQLLILKPHSHHAPRPLLHNPIQRLSKSYRIFLSNSRHSDWTIKSYPSILSKRVKQSLFIIIINEKYKKKNTRITLRFQLHSHRVERRREEETDTVFQNPSECAVSVCVRVQLWGYVYIYIYICVCVYVTVTGV